VTLHLLCARCSAVLATLDLPWRTRDRLAGGLCRECRAMHLRENDG